MDKELKAKWIEALRSGKYQQTRAQLYREHATATDPAGYCCLGVLCKVAPIAIDEPVASMAYGTLHGMLGDKAVDKLWTMNDDGASFVQIADYIEANL